MSGSQSFLRRTEDLKRLKTRALYIEGEDGSLPGANTLPVFGSAGDIQFSDIEVIGGDSMVIPGDLTVEGVLTVSSIDASSGSFTSLSAEAATIQDLSAAAATIQDLSADHIWTNTEIVASRLDICGSAAVIGGLSVGQAHGVHELDVAGHVFIDSDGSASRSFTVPGIYTFTVPASISTLSFEMIGSGGLAGGGGNVGGTGGYMRGSINVAAFAGQVLTIQVGAAGGATSYISKAGTGPLFTVAGGGGGGGGPAGGVPGGAGGGDAFVAGVANGKDGVDYPGVGNSRGRGGSTVGGAGGVPASGPEISNGAAGANPAGFVDAAGGGSGAGARGGNGYAGGGESGSVSFGAGSGGGGSSFYNTTYVSLLANFAGDNAGLAGILAGYGRSGQGGYVSISYAGQPSLQTTGDIVCGGNLDISGNITTDDIVCGGNLDISGNITTDGNLNVKGNMDICGSISQIILSGSFFYKQPSGTLFTIPRKVLISSTSYTGITSTSINIASLGSPFNTLKKIKILVDGELIPTSPPLPGFTVYLNWQLNGTTPALPGLPICQVADLSNPTLFVARHTYELSQATSYTTKLLNYGSYEARSATGAGAQSAFYHPTNLDLGSTTISSLTLTTSVGITTSLNLNIYAYI